MLSQKIKFENAKYQVTNTDSDPESQMPDHKQQPKLHRVRKGYFSLLESKAFGKRLEIHSLSAARAGTAQLDVHKRPDSRLLVVRLADKFLCPPPRRATHLK